MPKAIVLSSLHARLTMNENAAAPKQYQAGMPVGRVDHRSQVQCVAAIGEPDVARDNDVTRRRVAESSGELSYVAVEIKEQRSERVAEAIDRKRLVRADHVFNRRRRRAEGLVGTVTSLARRQVEEIKNDQGRADRAG